MLRRFVIMIAYGLTVLASPCFAQSSSEAASQRAELARQIRQAVEDLHALHGTQRRAEELHSQRAGAIQRQIELLQKSLQPVLDAAKTEREEIATLDGTITEHEKSAEYARVWINHTADAVRSVAEHVRQRVSRDAGEEKLRRFTEVNETIELLSDNTPLTKAEGIREFLRVFGDQWLPARSVTLGNQAVFTDGGQKMEHAWVVGFGLVAKVFVSVVDKTVGIWSGNSESDWNLDLPEDALQQVRDLVDVVRQRRPPSVTPLPVASWPETSHTQNEK